MTSVTGTMQQVAQALFACNHTRTPVDEGKAYCPDCGAGVVFHWVLLRCSGCNSRREARYFMRQVVPAHSHCLYCGESVIRREVLASPKFYQVTQALLVMSPESAYTEWLSERLSNWTGRFWGHLWQQVGKVCQHQSGSVRVWLEPQAKSQQRQGYLQLAS